MRNLSLPFLLPLGHGLEGLLHLVLQLMGEAGGKPVALKGFCGIHSPLTSLNSPNFFNF